MSRAENLISPAADKVTVKLIYQHLINPCDSARCPETTAPSLAAGGGGGGASLRSVFFPADNSAKPSQLFSLAGHENL